ncbi:MAG TPA: hypothetical protein VG454_11325 [Gemmatimonadales bacterium]|nr:hypothetical protein [Gemmatimonadales bacterium]
MLVRRSLLILALTLMVARCADQPTGLNSVAAASKAGPQFLTWAGSTPQFSARSSRPHNGNGRSAAMSPPLSLDTYQVSFWAVRGEARSVQINYQSSIDQDNHPFLRLTTTDPQFVPGVGELAVGDSVLITVNIDTTKIGVSLEPSGLQFGEPSQLQIWYGGANGDYNGDGIVDSTDANVEQQLLGLWYREGEGDQWTHLSASQNLDDKSFTYALPHFCEYAIAELLELAVSW